MMVTQFAKRRRKASQNYWALMKPAKENVVREGQSQREEPGTAEHREKGKEKEDEQEEEEKKEKDTKGVKELEDDSQPTWFGDGTDVKLDIDGAKAKLEERQVAIFLKSERVKRVMHDVFVDLIGRVTSFLSPLIILKTYYLFTKNQSKKFKELKAVFRAIITACNAIESFYTKAGNN